MYSEVIVPLDGSELAEGALRYAELVARALSVPIELVEAFDVIPPTIHGQGTMIAIDEMLAEARRRSSDYLAWVREQLRTEGFAVATAVLPGTAERAIVDRAGSDPDALVVMSTHGRGGIARWALGSVADKVLHSIPNPVLIVRAGGGSATTRDASVDSILVPLDGSELAELSLPHAVSLASALQARIVLLRVSLNAEHYRHHLGGTVGQRTTFGDPVDQLAGDLAGTEAGDADTYLTDVRRRLAVEYPQMERVSLRHVPSDNVAQAIIDAAASEPSLLVMTTHGRSGIGRLVLGSVTDRVVRHSQAPVLVVRDHADPSPAGLEAPIASDSAANFGSAGAQPA